MIDWGRRSKYTKLYILKFSKSRKFYKMACPYASTDADQLRSSGQVFLNIWIFWFGTELIFWAKEHFWRILCGKNEDLAAFWLHLTTFQFSGTLCNFMLLRFCGNGNQGFWWFCDSWGAIVWPHESTFFLLFSFYNIFGNIWDQRGPLCGRLIGRYQGFW